MGLLKNAHLPCCAANRTAQCISIYASRFGFLRALHLNIFEQPPILGFFNNPAMMMFIGRKLCLLRVEVQHFYLG
jgi:hypothetical protein